MSRYRLTAVFLVVSAVTIGISAFVINVMVRGSAETMVLTMATNDAARDTKLIAKIIADLTSGDATGRHGATNAAPGDVSTSRSVSVQYPDLLEALDVIDMKLYDVSGATLWSSGGEIGQSVTPAAGIFAAAIDGSVTSELKRDADIGNTQGLTLTADIVQTYIPVTAGDGGKPVAVISVSRDVTEGLASNIGQVRSETFKTTAAAAGAVFVVLLGFVVVADDRIGKANLRAITSERKVSANLGHERDKLQEVNAAKSKFFSMITHELNTPLTSNIAFVELVARNKDKNLTPQQLHQLEVARRNAQRLQRLISELLDMSRVEQGSLSIQPTEFDPRKWLQDVAQEIGPTLQAKSQLLKVTLPAEGLIVHADRDRLVQSVITFISNASNYSAEGHDIELEGKVEDGELVISVRDHGIGMTEDEQKGLFTMYYRVANDDTKTVKGNGIGLAVTRQIIERHNGKISVSSARGAGTTIRFRVPLRQDAAAGAVNSEARAA